MAALKIPEKMVEWTLWMLWVLIFGGALWWVLIGSIVLWVGRSGGPPETTVADWVQAIGSIGAILGAVWAAWHTASSQRRQSERDARDRALVVTKALSETARRGAMWSEQMFLLYRHQEVFKQQERFEKYVELLESEWRRAQEIKLIDLPRAEMVEPLLQLITNLEICADCGRLYLAAGVEIDSLNMGTRLVLGFEILQDLSKRFGSS